MSELVPHFGDVLSSSSPSRQSAKEVRRLTQAAGVEQVRLLHRQALAEQRVAVVAHAGTRAMQAQVALSAMERRLVEFEPAAVHGISYISQAVTIGLGQVVNNLIAEVTR